MFDVLDESNTKRKRKVKRRKTDEKRLRYVEMGIRLLVG